MSHINNHTPHLLGCPSPGHVLPVDGEDLVPGHQLVHAGAAARHEPKEEIVNN